MTLETIELVKALRAVTANVEHIANALLTGQMSPAAQRRYAELLEELAVLLFSHADDQEAGASNEVR